MPQLLADCKQADSRELSPGPRQVVAPEQPLDVGKDVGKIVGKSGKPQQRLGQVADHAGGIGWTSFRLRPKLYGAKDSPRHWIAEDDAGELVRWPAKAGGWTERTVYRGGRKGLTEVNPTHAYGTGWPGAPGRGRPARAGGEAADARITIRLTDVELEKWTKAAGQQSLGEWVRAACNKAAS